MLKALFNNHEQEAKTFEERTGLSGISREYSLPRGLTPEKLEKCLKSPMFNALFNNFSHKVKLLTQQFTVRSDLSPAEKLNS